mmetsp:Transcript_12925/g.20471  ORF Transcript_12925/g.20471 Transcript_12925/m.20471 type:complete len:410 (-) Transcript_12925:133-1362(-)
MAVRKGLKYRPRARAVRKTEASTKARGKANRIRIGVLVGKNFDPIARGTQDRAYPERFKQRKNTGRSSSGWGGMFHVDVATGLKIARLHPDVFEIDFMTGLEVTEARLKRNHLNLNMFYDVVIASFKGDKNHIRQVRQGFTNPECRMWPSFDYYDWVCNKPRYMKQCIKAGIPMIDTIFVEDGFDPDSILRKVRAKGWEKFFVKSAAYVCYGNSAIFGKTQDFIDNPSLMHDFLKDNSKTKSFLVQPFVLKPDGKVFDEVRNFFIDGKWAYSVYTDGTDDDAVYEQPRGALKDACRKLSERVYKEVLKASKWQGKPMTPILNRIDIGVVPDRSKPHGFRIFCNEIETEISTWLARYAPFDVADRVGEACVKKSRELLRGLLDSGRKMSDQAMVEKLLGVLDERLGPLTA